MGRSARSRHLDARRFSRSRCSRRGRHRQRPAPRDRAGRSRSSRSWARRFRARSSPRRRAPRVAWVFDERGARNVWVAEAPAFAGRRLTAYQHDDGQEITDLAFSPDGATLVYVRGGGANRAGEIPNPSSDAGRRGAGGLGGAGRRRRAAPARRRQRPGVSPTGDAVAFVQRGQIWIAGLSGTPAAAPGRACARLGAARWPGRPTASRLAFVSGRGTHAFVGVVDVATKALTWLEPSLDTDDAPVWSPDGARVAFIRRPPVRDRDDSSIPSARASRGRSASPRWRPARPRGVARRRGPRAACSSRSSSARSSSWTADERLVFPWEGDGWKHLYSVPASGGEAALLTPGAFEVDDVSYAPDGAHAVVSSNQDDIDRRHLWRVTTSGAAPPVRADAGSRPRVEPGGAGRRHVGGVRARAMPGGPGQPAMITGGAAPRELAAAALPASIPERRAGRARGGRRSPPPTACASRDRSSGRPTPAPAGQKRPGAHLLPRRIAPPDAARLELPQLLPQRLRLQSVHGEPRLRRALGQLSAAASATASSSARR